MEISKEHRAAIGTVAVEWSHLESCVELAIWGLAGLRHIIGLTITADMGFKAKRDALETLFSLWLEVHPSDGPRIKQISDALKDAESERNNLFHQYMWQTETNPQLINALRISAYGKLDVQHRKNLTPNYINSIAKKIQRAHDLLSSFLRDHDLDARRYERPPWLRIPGKQDSQSD